MPMLSAMARTTVGPAPRKRPTMPSSFTIRTCRHVLAAPGQPDTYIVLRSCLAHNGIFTCRACAI